MTLPDPLFDHFLAALVSMTRDTRLRDDERARIAAREIQQLLRQGWRIADRRYVQCQPDKPYGSYLLYLDPDTGFSVVLDVFSPGQAATIHDHGTWGAFGCKAGAERERHYQMEQGQPVPVSVRTLLPGDVTCVLPPGDALHQVECASTTGHSISLHCYGNDIGHASRRRWNPASRQFELFSSGYSNDIAHLPVYRQNTPFD